MSTEQKFWQAMRRACPPSGPLRLTRFETRTATGVADVEYVSAHAHGWVELKVGTLRRGVLRLQKRLTIEQVSWLLSHERPPLRLRSWLAVRVGVAVYQIPAPETRAFHVEEAGGRFAPLGRWLLHPTVGAFVSHLRDHPGGGPISLLEEREYGQDRSDP